VEKFDGVGDVCGGCCRDVDRVTPVMLGCITGVPPVKAVWCPCVMLVGLLV
jgi:hypothetical protein